MAEVTVAELVARLRADTAGFNSAITGAAGTLNKLQGAAGGVGGGLQRLGSGIVTAGATMSRWGRGMQTMGGQMTRYMTLPLVGIGAAAVKTARDFDQAMANVNSIMKVSGKRLGQYSDQVLDMTKKLPQSAEELATGLYNIASSGFTGAKAMKVLEASARAASAGMTDTETSSRAIVAALNAYGMSAQDAGEVSDILFKGVEVGVMRFDELANSMGDYVALASQLKVPLQDVVAAQAAMTLSGVNAFEASTSLNNMLRSMLKPSEELKGAFKDMGYESGRLALQEMGLQGVLDSLSKRVGENTEEWVKLFPEIRAARGAITLTAADGAKLDSTMKALAMHTGATGQALEKQAEGFGYKWKLMVNRLKLLLIDLGNTLIPIILDTVVPAIKAAVRWFEALPDAAKKWVVIGGIAAAALGPVLGLTGALFRLGGWVLGKVGAVVRGLGLLAAGIAGVGAASSVGAVGAGVHWIDKIGTTAAASGTVAAASASKWAMLGRVFNPVTAAITLATAAVVVNIAESRKWTGAVEDMESKARSGALGLGDLTEGVRSFESKLEEAVGTTSAMGDPIGKMKGLLEELSDELENTAVAAGLAGEASGTGFLGSVRDATGEVGEWTRMLMSSRNLTLDQAKAMLGMVGSLKALGGTIEPATKRMIAYRLSIGDVKGAMGLLEGILDDVRESVEKHVRAVMGNAKAYKEWGSALSSAEGMTRKQRAVIGDMLGGLESAGVKIDRVRKAMLDQAIAAGNAGKATKILHGIIDSLPDKKRMKVEAELSAALAQVKALKAQIDGLRNKTVTITTRHLMTSQREGLHGGGMVLHGGGMATRMHAALKPDDVPAVLQRGEGVIRKRSMRVLGGPRFLRWANRLHEGGVAGHAHGGAGGAGGGAGGSLTKLLREFAQLERQLKGMSKEAERRTQVESALGKVTEAISRQWQRRMDSQSKAFEALQMRVEEFTTAVADFQASVRDAILGFADVTQFDYQAFTSEQEDAIRKVMDTGKSFEEALSSLGLAPADAGKQLLDNMQQQLDQATAFSNLLQNLTAQGLDPALVQQLAAAGPAALDILRAIQMAGVENVNKLQEQITTLANQLGTKLSEPLFGKQARELEKAVEAFKRSFDEFRKEFKALPPTVQREFKQSVGEVTKGLDALSRMLRGIPGVKITAAQHGFEGVVRGPRLFLAGEAGPERVSIGPVGSGGARGFRAGGGKSVSIYMPVTVHDSKDAGRRVLRDLQQAISDAGLS